MKIPPQSAPSYQTVAAVTASSALLVCAIALIWDFVPALLWAGVLALALWPAYVRVTRAGSSGFWARFGSPFCFTLALALLLAIPLALATIELGHAAEALGRWILAVRRDGIPVPAFVQHLPLIGHSAVTWWNDNLSDPRAATNLMRQVEPGQIVIWSRVLGEHVVREFVTVAFTLIALFFLFRDGEALRASYLRFVDRVFGTRGLEMSRHAVAAIDGTVIGLVLVGLGEGAVIGLGYWIANVPHAALLTIGTAILAIIPMGAPVAFTAASAFLYIEGHSVSAVAIFILGVLVVTVADYVVRPVLIGNAAKLPFLLVLLGTLGGISTMGVIGLFIGPVLMAVLAALWRDISHDADTAGP